MIYKRILAILLVISLSIAFSPIMSVFANEATVGLYQTISGKSVIKADGSLWNWSDNKPKKILDNVASISEGSNFTLALKTDNTLWSWGNNEYGQLGDGMTVNRIVPKMILEDVASIAASEYFAMAIKTDGSLWAWGDNTVGQIGNGGVSDSVGQRSYELIQKTPVKIMDEVSSVYVNAESSDCFQFVLAIKTDGSLWGWGQNEYGELGNNQQGNSKHLGYLLQTTPVKIMDDVKYASVGECTAMVIKNDGSLWGWGNNQFGEIGNGYQSNAIGPINEPIQNTPVKIMEDVLSVKAAGLYVVALKTDGSLWAWGDNGYSDLGCGDQSNDTSKTGYITKIQTIPVKIMDDVKSFSANLFVGTAIKNDGSLWSWGHNRHGGVGNGTTDPVKYPIKVMDNVAFVNVDESTTTIVKTDGSLLACGKIGDTVGNAKNSDYQVVQTIPLKIMDSIRLPYYRTKNPIGVRLNGADLSFDQVPIMQNNRTLVPMRAIFEAMGSTVKWNDDQSITATKDNTDIIMYIGKNAMNVNGHLIQLDTPPQIFNDSTFIPVRAIAEAFGATVNWDGEKNMVLIDTNEVVEYKKITPEQAKQLLENKNVLLIDVRTPDEYKTGHIKGSVNVTNTELKSKIAQFTSDKDTVIIVNCRSGARSKVSAEELIGMGFTNVSDLGGIIDWPYEIEK